MTTVTNVNNDLESKRIQRNMTETQKRNASYVKEGKIVNSFVKDPNLSLDETLDTLVISQNEVNLPQKVFEKEKKKNKSLIYMALASTGLMAVIGIFTALIKNFSKKHYESTQEYLLPGITRNHCINNEVHQSIFSMIQSPNRKTVMASIGVIALASMAFMAKTFIDGFRDVWIKKREADIQKNLQENLIAIETQSFSGKIQIIRSMLTSKAKEFSSAIDETCQNKIAFGKTEKKDKRNNDNKYLSLLFAGGLTLAGIITLGYFSISNLRKSEEFIKKGMDNTKKGLDDVIKDFNSKKSINNIENHEGKTLSGIDAYKYLIENMLESIYAKPEEIEDYVNKMNLSQTEKEEFIKQYLSEARKSPLLCEDMAHMEQYLAKGMDQKEAMKCVAKDRGVSKRDVYQYLLNIKKALH